jgi:aminopeptidase N
LHFEFHSSSHRFHFDLNSVYAVPQEPRKAYLKDDTYRDAYVAAQGLLSNAVQGSMAIDAWMQRPGSEPLKEVLRPALEGQLADVATGQAMLQLLTELQTEADMERASEDATAAVLPAAVQVSSRMIAKILI